MRGLGICSRMSQAVSGAPPGIGEGGPIDDLGDLVSWRAVGFGARCRLPKPPCAP